ncbi:MAG: YbaN family protein [Bacillota bacterium]|nr:YbaN family protein [Bacillota bacterium]
MRKIVLLILGCSSLVLGVIGAFVPLLPTVPFLLLSAYCFTRSSKKLYGWLIETKIYKYYLSGYSADQGMTKKQKIKIMIKTTIIIIIGIIMLGEILIGRIILGVIWILHLIYFTLGVKTVHA